MKIGIIGAGHIGATLARLFAGVRSPHRRAARSSCRLSQRIVVTR
jgi:predicted dinucleotide-binding enzyme